MADFSASTAVGAFADSFDGPRVPGEPPLIGPYQTRLRFSTGKASAITASGDERLVFFYSAVTGSMHCVSALTGQDVGFPIAADSPISAASNTNGTLLIIGSPFSFPKEIDAYNRAPDFDLNQLRHGSVISYGRQTPETAWFVEKEIAGPTPRKAVAHPPAAIVIENDASVLPWTGDYSFAVDQTTEIIGIPLSAGSLSHGSVSVALQTHFTFVPDMEGLQEFVYTDTLSATRSVALVVEPIKRTLLQNETLLIPIGYGTYAVGTDPSVVVSPTLDGPLLQFTAVGVFTVTFSLSGGPERVSRVVIEFVVQPQVNPGKAQFGRRVVCDETGSFFGISSMVIPSQLGPSAAPVAAPSVFRRTKNIGEGESSSFSPVGGLDASGIISPLPYTSDPISSVANAATSPPCAFVAVSGDGAMCALTTGHGLFALPTSLMETIASDFTRFSDPSDAERRFRHHFFPQRPAQFGECDLDYRGQLLAASVLPLAPTEKAEIWLFDLSRNFRPGDYSYDSSYDHQPVPFQILVPPAAVTKIGRVRVSKRGSRVAVTFPQIGAVAVYSVFQPANRVERDWPTVPRVSPSWVSPPGSIATDNLPDSVSDLFKTTYETSVEFSNYDGSGLLIAASAGSYQGAALFTSPAYVPPSAVEAPPMLASAIESVGYTAAMVSYGLAPSGRPPTAPKAPAKVLSALDPKKRFGWL